MEGQPMSLIFRKPKNFLIQKRLEAEKMKQQSKVLLLTHSDQRLTLMWAALAITLGALFSQSLNALERNGDRLKRGSRLAFGTPEWRAQMTEDGLVALYLFNETSGVVRDVSGVGESLNLVIDDTNADTRPNRRAGELEIRNPTLIHSNGPARKIYDRCRASNELSVEVWLRNAADAQLPRINPIRILTYSNPRGNTLSSMNRNFFLGQEYVDASRYRGVIRTSNSALGGEIGINPNITTVNEIQRVVMTRGRNGVTKMYVSQQNETGGHRLILRNTLVGQNELLGNFNNWDADAVFGLGNEISYRDPRAEKPIIDREQTRTTSEDRAWLGSLYMVAVYCNELGQEDLLGLEQAGNEEPMPPVNANFKVTDNHKRAALLYRRLNSVAIPITHPTIIRMAEEIATQSRTGWLKAARIATDAPEFYNITVRDFAALMSTREETVNSPLNDFIATIIGFTRDDLNAQQLFTSNVYYMGDPEKAPVESRLRDDVVTTNKHYLGLEGGRFNLKDVLVARTPQMLDDGRGGIAPNPDAAGLLTTRGWMEAHATAGTNRRLVEYTFRQFLCIPMEQWADAYGPDNRIGRDIDRFPAGEHNTFQTTCKACHTVMDGFRGAFARFDFSNGIIKNSFFHSNGEGENQMAQMPAGVSKKMNHNEEVFPRGFVISDDQWVNYAVRGANAAFFGWKGKTQGYGVRDFGELISTSEAFPRCMTQRAYRSLCKRDPATFERGMIQQVSKEFAENGYKLRFLFEAIAITPDCIGSN